MKSILISIKPKWCEKIVNGEKTIEVRKTAPKEAPFKVYIYCTKGGEELVYCSDGEYVLEKGNTPLPPTDMLLNGKVIGEFICNQIESIPVSSYAFVSISKPACLTLDELIDYCSGNDMYGLHIFDLKIYDKPKELSEFCVARPPQSWQYVEGLKE